MGRIAKRRVRKILELHTKAKTHAEASKYNASMALRFAWECGIELNTARDELPHGSWERWCRECLPELSLVTIYRYRRLANEFAELPAAEEAGSIRQIYLLLGIGGHDTNPSHGKDLDEMKLKPGGGVLVALNAIMKWLNEERARQPFHSRDDKEITVLKRDLKPVYDRLKELFEDPRGKESF